MPRRKTLKLSTPADIRRSITRIGNMILNGDITHKQGTALIYACNSALNVIKVSKLQSKVDELESLLAVLTERNG